MANPTKVTLDYDSTYNIDGYLRRPSDGQVYQGGAGGNELWHVWADVDVIKYAMAYTKYNDGYFVCAFPTANVAENVEYDWVSKQRVGADPAVGDIKLGAMHYNRKQVLDTDGLGEVSTTEPTGLPATWDIRGWILAIGRRFFNKRIFNGSTAELYKDDNSTVLTIQNTSDVAGVETMDKAV